MRKPNVASLLTKRELKVLIEALDYAVEIAESTVEGIDYRDWDNQEKVTAKDRRDLNKALRQHERFAWIRAQLNNEPGR